MTETRVTKGWLRLLALVIALLAMGFAAAGAQAARPTGEAASAAASSIAGDSRSQDRHAPLPPDRAPLNDAYLELRPQGSAPPNGGTANVGDRFVLELWVVGASHTDLTAQQSYLTWTHQILQNARVDQIATSCVITSSVTTDSTTFDAQLQNEVCNGPNPCNFRGNIVDPGSYGFASGALNNPPAGGSFRVAQFGICAVAGGQARLHWQFTPPAPPARDTQIVDSESNLVHNPALFVDYIINVAGGATNTPTPTTAVTNTPTSTTVPPTNTSTRTNTATNTITVTRTNTPTHTNTATRTNTAPAITNTPTATATSGACQGAYHYLTPEAGSPPNGGTVNVGDRFTLGMMVHTAQYFVTVQQAYLTFTHELLQNVNAGQTGCVLTNTVTTDTTVFDAVLQNEVCNGPNPCNFRGNTVAPGSIGYASGALNNPPYNGPDFRVARLGFCAVAPGTARIVWEFSPPSPPTRDTQIVDENNNVVHDRACYQTYVINIVGGATNTPTRTNTSTSTATHTATTPPTLTHTRTNTPTITNTPVFSNTPTHTRTHTPVPTITNTRTHTPTNTNTPLPPTITNTHTHTNTPLPPTITNTPLPPTITNTPLPPTITNTPTPVTTGTVEPGQGCRIAILSFQPCMNSEGCVSYSIPVSNQNNVAVTVEGTVALVARGDEVIGMSGIPPTVIEANGITNIDGTVCPTIAAPGPYRVEVLLRISGTTCEAKRKSQPVRDTCETLRDVPQGAWFFDYVNYLSAAGIISGYSDGTFRPYNKVTRGQAAKLVALAFNLPAGKSTVQRFSDVPASHTFHSYIEAAYNAGLVHGYGDGTFRPQANVTRAQIAKIVVLAAGWALITPERPAFTDLPAGSTFYSYVETARAMGLLSGYEDGTFRPDSDVTRAQLSKVLYTFVRASEGE